MQVFDINQVPGVTRLIDQVADYVYYLSGSAGGADTTIAVRPQSGGETVYLKPGQAYKFGQGEGAARWSITNLKGEAAIIGQLLFSTGEFTDNRVSGSVEVIDGGKARTNAGQAFMSWGDLGGAVGVNSVHQLWNPAGSGKNVIIEQISASSVAGGFAGFAFWNAALPTLVAANGGSGTSKKSGIGASTAQRRTDQTAVLPYGPSLFSTSLTANVNFDRKFNEPVLLTPGMGFCIFHGSPNTEIAVGLEWFEEIA